jgi:hypothetical protein
MNVYGGISREISGKGEGKGKDSEGWRGWKYTVYMHMKTAQ